MVWILAASLVDSAASPTLLVTVSPVPWLVLVAAVSHTSSVVVVVAALFSLVVVVALFFLVEVAAAAPVCFPTPEGPASELKSE